MTDKERMMDKLYGAVAGLFLVYGISTEEYVGKIIIDLLNEAEKQFQFKEQECEELHTELNFKVEYIQEQREVIKDLEKKLKIVIEALKDIYDKADEIYFDQDRTSLFCKQVRGISIQALKELE